MKSKRLITALVLVGVSTSGSVFAECQQVNGNTVKATRESDATVPTGASTEDGAKHKGPDGQAPKKEPGK